MLSGVPYACLSAEECQTIEGEIQLWQGWPPWIRIESRDKKSVFGINTDAEVTESDFMPKALMKQLYTNPSLTGTFCIELTGDKTTVPYDDRVIKYVRIIRYKIEGGKSTQRQKVN